MENKTGNKIDDKKEIKISKESDLKKVTANGWIVNSETFAGAQLFVNIAKKFTFNGFENSLEFTSRIGSLAKLLNHHPEIFIAYDSVTITLSTHDAVEQLKSAGQGTGSNADANSDSVSNLENKIKGLVTENDIKFAEKADEIEKQIKDPQLSGLIDFDTWAKVEMKVGEIVSAEPLPKSDKLLRLMVNIGDKNTEGINVPRQILSGIAKYVEGVTGADCKTGPAILIGKKCMFVANLLPRTMMGEKSNGMIAAVSTEDGTFALLEPVILKAGTDGAQNGIPAGTKAK